MSTTVKFPASAQVVQMPNTTLASNISYEIVPMDHNGYVVPLQIGEGRFAKVYKASQRSAGRHIRPVAIKILHDNANRAEERLFRQEADLLKDLTTVQNLNVVNTLDIIHLGPMIMCGCGAVYHPRCPRCGEMPLQRKDPPGKEHPSLYCLKCPDYELSGEDIQNPKRYVELLRPPAKPCCKTGPTEHRGTIINFVDRTALVMEFLDRKLQDFTEQRRHVIDEICMQYRVHRAERADQKQTWLRAQWEQNRDDILLHKVILLEKLYLMVQLAEGVAWLHGEKKIVHKDLAPDNVMVRLIGDESGLAPWRGNQTQTLRERLQDMASYPSHALRLIDFGLADKDELSRVWYEEQDVGAAVIKLPYLSPEARLRKTRINDRIEFFPEDKKFLIPRDLMAGLSVMPGDILADNSDASHDHDLEIIEVEQEPGSGRHFARYRGEPPVSPLNHQFELVRRLGEAHDVFAVGALFYYILTGKNEEVSRLGALVTSLEDKPCELTPAALMRRDVYDIRRNALAERFWQDELMVLILRAMIRGQPQSFVRSRIQRGPEPAQALLRETKRIYYGLQQEILSAPRVSRLHRGIVAATASALSIGTLGGYLLSHVR
jgi:serine/threonine protein kinase